MQVGASYMRKSESTHFLPFSLVALYLAPAGWGRRFYPAGRGRPERISCDMTRTYTYTILALYCTET